MKRWIALLVLIATSVVMAAEPWMNSYHSAMAAVAKSDWKSAAEHLEKAIAAKPTEVSFTNLRSGSGPYLPHYWLGTARIQLGDKERGAQELRISESQGAIQKTAHYSDLRNALARIEREKSSSGDASLATLRSSTDKTLTTAVAAKGKATAAGASRTEVYGRAAQKLQDAFELRKAGDAASLNRAAALAKEATDLFSRLSSSTPVNPKEQQKPPVPTPTPPRPQSDELKIELVDTQAAERQLRALRKEIAAASGAAAASPQLSEFTKKALEMAAGWDKSLSEVESQADTDAIERGIAQQRAELKRLLALNTRTPDVPSPSPDPITPKPVVVPGQQPSVQPQKIEPTPVQPPGPSSELQPAGVGDASLRSALLDTFVLFGRGELDLAEKKATTIIDSTGRFEAYLLRGCTRYTRALLLNKKELESDAAADFVTARTLNPAAKLDRRAFSPKLIAFFESSGK